jgi:hypothetical protein
MELKPGDKVRVNAANPAEGTDHEWHGHRGVVTRITNLGPEVRMYLHKRNWPDGPVVINWHNLERE